MAEDNEGVNPQVSGIDGHEGGSKPPPKIDVAELRKRLFGISDWDDESPPRSSPSDHIHTNDIGYGHALSEVSPNDVESSKNRVGLIIGNGAVLSSLPNIPAEILVMADSNNFIPTWTQITASALLESNSPAEYMAKVYSTENSLYQELKDRGHKPEEDLEKEIRNLGDQHFLSSQERFNECKEALQKKHIVYFNADISATNNLNNLASVLEQNNAEITFANMTNVWDHVKFAGRSLADTLPILPFNPRAIIMHSSQGFNAPGERDVVREGPIQRGVQQYLDAAQQAFIKWRGSK